MSDEQPPRTLVRKLAAVMASVARVPKRGYNDFHKYKYVLEADIVETIRAELAQRHVMLFVDLETQERTVIGKTSSGREAVLTTAHITFTFEDGESGETRTFHWQGTGLDSEDKGLAKAQTTTEKYFLLKTFLMPTGDDNEATDEEGRSTARNVEPMPAPAGLDAWLNDLSAVADNGEAALRVAWAKSPSTFKDFLSQQRGPVWARLKTQAAKVKS